MSFEIPASQKAETEEEKKEQVLLMRLPADSVVLDGTHIDLNKFLENPLAKDLMASLALRHQPTPDVPKTDKQAPVKEESNLRSRRLRKRRISTIYAFNVMFILFVTLTSLVPAILSTSFGTEIYASSSDAPSAKIFKHDVMISKITRAADLKTDDVMLVRNDYTWQMGIRQVSSVSIASNMATINTTDGEGTTRNDSYTIANSTQIHKIIRVVPQMGFWLSLFTSIYAKILGGCLLLLVNIVLQVRRFRRIKASELQPAAS